MKLKKVLVVISILMVSGSVADHDFFRLSNILHGQANPAIPGVHHWPATTLYDPASLLYARDQYLQGNAPYTTAVDSLKAAADRLLEIKPFSVMQKKMVPPSGDKHDYYSLGVYWWPNPDTENGLPYIRKDGIRNPEYADYDGPAIRQMADAVFTLSMSWFYTSDAIYARKATAFLNTWFLDPATRMKPHLEYGQAIPGRTEGRGIGIIETGNLVKVVNGIELLEGSEELNEKAYNNLKRWFKTYSNWLVTSQNGWDERRWHNNHGSSYDSQVATFALFSGQDSIAAMILDSVKVKRIARQIMPDGSQPWELDRTKAMSYSVKNLHHLIENAILAEGMGIDLWSYEPEPGRSILNAIQYLIPFFAEGKDFPYQQIGGIEPYVVEVLELMWVASQYISDPSLTQIMNEFPAEIPDYSLLHLTYPNILLNAQSPGYPVVKGFASDLFTIGELLHEDKLDNQANFQSDWVVQMNTQGDFERYAEIRNGKLEVLDPSGCTIWLKKKLKGPLCISYKVIVSSERDTGNIIRPRDINNFWLAGESGNLKNILDSKKYTGKFSNYHGMQGYYASMGGGSANKSNRTVRMRIYPRTRNDEPYEHLALISQDGNQDFKIVPDQEYRIQLVAYEDLIQFLVNEQVVYEAKYGLEGTATSDNKNFYPSLYSPEKYPVYREGYFGFRMTHSMHIYYDLKVYQLNELQK